MRNSIFENFRDRHIFVLQRNYGEEFRHAFYSVVLVLVLYREK